MTKQETNNFKEKPEKTWKFAISVIFSALKLVLYGLLHVLVEVFWSRDSRLWGKMTSKGSSSSRARDDDDDNVNGGGSNCAGKDDPAIPETVASIRRHHKQAYAYIAKALNIDEAAGNCDAKDKAVEWYRKGIEELNKGIEIVCDGEGSEWERARNLQSKMEDNLNSTTERMNELVALLSSQAAGRSSSNGKKIDLKDSKSSKKPTTNSSNDRIVVGGKTPVVNQPPRGALRPRVNVDRRKPEAPPKINRRPYSQPEAGKSAERRVPSVNNLDELKRDQKKKVSYLKNVDSKIANKILDEVVQNSSGVTFDDVAGMDNAKRILQEIVILPALRPELFTGLRAPARGLLLYGPPGNGKTMLAKAVSHQAQSTFFNISAATLTSKWVGEGEKLVRALFAVARELQPSIIFIDEIDSLLCERKEGEQESSRRIKTEFLLAFDGLTSGDNEKILVMGATNRPQELDDAALRRLVKRVYLPLPDQQTRKILLEKLLQKHHSPLTNTELDKLATLTENYSGSDLTALARDAALGPIREMRPDQLQTVAADKVRNIIFTDFVDSMKNVRASVSPGTLKIFEEWTKMYGTQA